MHTSDVEKLFDALTDYACGRRAEIADVTGWPVHKVDDALRYVRRPDVASVLGWTVPHAQHGTGEHLYQVVLSDGGSALDADEHQHIRNGAVSTLRMMASNGENEGNALRLAAQYLSPAQARVVRQTATAAEGAAAMARHAAEVLA
jgi:hypothetical protein